MTTSPPRRQPLALGIDVGTSGVRAALVDAAGTVVSANGVGYPPDADRRDPETWWRAVSACLQGLAAERLASVTGVAVDGTSGTMLGLDAAGAPVGPAIMYDDPCSDASILSAIASAAPGDSTARGHSSALARAIVLQRRPGVGRVLHQADFIAARLAGIDGVSDANNALKTGYDPVAEAWPDWIGAAGMDVSLLPPVMRPGTPVARLGPLAETLGLPGDAILYAGTTDGCASFLATGASEPGDGVTALGSTLVLKLLTDRPVSAPRYGIYSHRIGDVWLAGGASNAGGAAIARFFDEAAIRSLTPQLAPDRPTGLDYYPLTRPGERFPVNDPQLAPRLEPRPEDDAQFLQGLLEGIAAIEALGYRRLAELGAPALRSVRTVGGGAANAAWATIRAGQLKVPLLPARSVEAAAGTARLALPQEIGA
ncbi:FGGY-family carbohydrate kinase [Jiella sonneratiae]|uniref:FGGY-family carbohydrate kinase n=1 Tax=Jiella sonneratiae TaxID=2816856 RepID=UPI003159C206